ncbi:MAG: hypothetical protein HY782_19270 [Chloroflexi bacterium]|nr:hypothetical protein [Chloroflexota bacterium]
MQKLIELLQRSIWLGPLIGLIVGIVIGLIIGWVVLPVSWTPNVGDVASMADAYQTNPAAATAFARSSLAGLSKEEQSRLFTEAIRSRTAAGNTLQAGSITALAQSLGVSVGGAGAVPPPGPTSPTAQRTPTPAGGAASPLTSLLPLIIIFVVVALIAAAALVFVTRVLPQLRAGQAMRRSQPAATAAAPPTARAAPPTAPTTTPGGLGRFVASYGLGNDNYDTSFSLETPRQEFLGECGMGISETIGEGKPDKVTAFDLWLFDKADVRTVTQIIMSEYAFNDQGLRSKLAAKGEAILAEKGKIIALETQSLRIAAQIVELVYANNASFPANSHFQKLTVEIVPALKEVVAA